LYEYFGPQQNHYLAHENYANPRRQTQTTWVWQPCQAQSPWVWNHTIPKRHGFGNHAKPKLLESNILGLTSMLNPSYVYLAKITMDKFWFLFGFLSRCISHVLTPLHLKIFLFILLFMVCVDFFFILLAMLSYVFNTNMNYHSRARACIWCFQ
jgi:hypothetical protein